MAFVYTSWYIVLAVLVLAVVGLVVAFIMMDKKDKVIIDNFLKEANAEADQQPSAQAETAVIEEKKE